MSLKHIEILAESLRRYVAQRDARLLAEQRMQAAFGPDVEVKRDDVKVIEVMA
jgi:hypothetical protein